MSALELDRARVDVDGVPAVDGLSFVSSSERLLVMGAPRALFEAVCGMREVAHGKIVVGGEAPIAAVRTGKLASAPLDPPMPPRWTVRTYVAWSARLAGHGRRAAAAMADDALARMKLTSMANAQAARATAQVRRAIVIAAALATGARTIVLDDPLALLPDAQARTLGRVLATALADRTWIAFVGRTPLASPLALEAEEAVVLAGSHVAAQGAPAEIAARDRSYALRVEGNAPALSRRLQELGARVSGAPEAMTVDLGELTTRELLAAAIEQGAVVVELRPASATFS
jgi:ABC-type cobalamin/Fe3+-siderophores transport system ATPase subunit